MNQNKTQPTESSVSRYLNRIVEEQRREDSWTIYNLMERITHSQGRMWGHSIVGFGEYHYKYESGREGDWFLTGFAPRKNTITIYLMCDILNNQLNFDKLGKHKKGKGCLHIKKIEHIDLNVLEQLIWDSIQLIRQAYQ